MNLRVLRPVLMDEASVAMASVKHNPISNQPEISVVLTAAGAVIFEDLTASHTMRQIAMILDGRLLYAPLIVGRISDGIVVIAGNFTEAEAAAIAAALNSKPDSESARTPRQ